MPPHSLARPTSLQASKSSNRKNTPSPRTGLPSPATAASSAPVSWQASVIPPAPEPAPPARLVIRDRLARNLIVARGVLRITQDGLAEAAVVSRATIAQIEGALADCRLSTLDDLARVLGVSPVLLLLSETEITALANGLSNVLVSSILGHLPVERLEEMNRLHRTGLQKNLLAAARLGIEAAKAAGLDSVGAQVGAGIGSVIRPGQGTAVGAVIGSSLEYYRRERPTTPFIMGDGGGI